MRVLLGVSEAVALGQRNKYCDGSQALSGVAPLLTSSSLGYEV